MLIIIFKFSRRNKFANIEGAGACPCLSLFLSTPLSPLSCHDCCNFQTSLVPPPVAAPAPPACMGSLRIGTGIGLELANGQVHSLCSRRCLRRSLGRNSCVSYFFALVWQCWQRWLRCCCAFSAMHFAFSFIISYYFHFIRLHCGKLAAIAHAHTHSRIFVCVCEYYLKSENCACKWQMK